MTPDRRRSLRCHGAVLTVVALLTLAVPAGALAQAAGPDATGGALAAERYYGSGSPPQPTARATSTTVASDGGPSWTTAILAGAVLVVAAAGLGLAIGRTTVRPHGVGA